VALGFLLRPILELSRMEVGFDDLERHYREAVLYFDDRTDEWRRLMG